MNRVLLLSTALTLAACDLGANNLAVEEADYGTPGSALSSSSNGSVMWMVDYQTTKAFDADGGTPLFAAPQFWQWVPRDLAPSHEHGNAIWVLHTNGWRIEYDIDGTMHSARPAIPNGQFPAEHRAYGNFAAGQDGAQYMTTTEVSATGSKQHYVYRQDPTTMDWTRVVGSNLYWASLDYDTVRDWVVRVDRENLQVVLHYLDPDTLVEIGELAIPGAPGQFNDFAVFGGLSAFTPGNHRIYLFDEFGDLEDVSVPADQLLGSKGVEFRLSAAVELDLWWTSRTSSAAPHTAGWFDVESVP
ncbi:MAG: hypothetical protein AAF721_06745 [Myxococcota bacterium]